MTEKISLPFVNKGKEFTVPTWTVKDQIELDKEMASICKEKKIKPADEEYGQLLNDKLILRQLHNIDEKVTVEDLQTLHPRDYVELIGLIYNSGRRGLRQKENFQDQ